MLFIHLEFKPHMVTLSRHDPGFFQVTPVVVVGGLGGPVPHPAEIICSSLVSVLFVTLVVPVLDICACTDVCTAEVFARSLCIKEQESQGSQKRNNGLEVYHWQSSWQPVCGRYTRSRVWSCLIEP